jgi:hypothetical protein
MWDTFIEDMVILLKLRVVLWKKTALRTTTEDFEWLSATLTRPWQTPNRISMLGTRGPRGGDYELLN